LDAAMVGRDKEIELLGGALDRVLAERRSHLFTLLGPAGVGKSRLVQEFVSTPGRARVLRGRCLSYGEGVTYFPLLELVQEAAGVERTDDLATARSKLTALLEGAEDRDRIVSLAAGLLAWGEPVAAQDGYWGVRKLFEHLARERPLVVVFDDIHWAEPAFLDLIEYLADWTRDAQVLLLCVARPELLEIHTGWAGGKMNATTILLEPLAADEVSRLIDNLLAAPDILRSPLTDPRGRRRQPAVVEEMLSMLIDDGLLRFDEGGWRAVRPRQHRRPTNDQLLLAARLDRLDAEERRDGAEPVEGKVFHAGAVTPSRPGVAAPVLPVCSRWRKGSSVGSSGVRRGGRVPVSPSLIGTPPIRQCRRSNGRTCTSGSRPGSSGLRESAWPGRGDPGYHLEQAYRYRVELGPSDETTTELGRAAADT
jgi:hypothetical protein